MYKKPRGFFCCFFLLFQQLYFIWFILWWAHSQKLLLSELDKYSFLTLTWLYLYIYICVCVCACVSLKENKNVVAKRKKIKVFTVSVSQGSLLEFGANGSLPSENKLCLFGLLDFDPRLQNRAPAWFNNCGLLVNFQPLPACECCVGAYLKRAVSNRECI